MKEGINLADMLRHLSQELAAAKIDQAEAEARRMLLAATNLSRSDFIIKPDRALTAAECHKLDQWLARRSGGEPLTRIIGQRDFWTLNLRVAPDVLDPRADTETIVEIALEILGDARNAPLRILDLGTGSGALLLALLAECKNATGLGIDLSPTACALAQDNAARNDLAARVTVQQGRWADGLSEKFDLIVSNPPYIETATIANLEPEVREHDPVLALDGGADGLAAYREIMCDLPRILAPNGLVILELGIGQAAAVARLAHANDLKIVGLKSDLGGVERALALRWA